MAIIVQKYGGTSVETIEKINNIAEHIVKRKSEGNDMVIVVSAMGKTTDHLINMAHEISPDPDKRELDVLMATGEQVSMSLLSIALNNLDADAVSFTGQQVGIRTNGSHTKSKIADINEEKIREEHRKGKIVIVAGFQGVNEYNEITTLGRGGSDTTAVALAAKLGAQCEIYTDVDGIYTIDPRLYPRAKKLDCISYEEMLEMASSGASVMHSRSIELAEKYKVPVLVALSRGDIPGTIIKEMDNTMENTAITGLAVNNDEAIITLNGVPHDIKVIAEIFQSIANKDINIDMISQTFPVNKLVSISFTLPKTDLYQASKVLNTFKKKLFTFTYETCDNITKLSVVGLGMNTQSGVAAKVFNLLAENDIPVSIVTTSEIKISYVISPDDQKKAIEAIAKEFDL
ncbi:MAG TPA: aspartate kinase [Bacillota bacterium]|nr:aspartate kinase [Clostridiaceae bacterium]HNR04821.1 aspartate kinase [Bacillota bacterium]HNT03448.1 aspartate kinase [Bacillota bacterium]HPX68104.1 aspartate kinase [Bacillota bacterium]HQA64480.1 aspartate kinase [Bacillota bacterium]